MFASLVFRVVVVGGWVCLYCLCDTIQPTTCLWLMTPEIIRPEYGDFQKILVVVRRMGERVVEIWVLSV